VHGNEYNWVLKKEEQKQEQKTQNDDLQFNNSKARFVTIKYT